MKMQRPAIDRAGIRDFSLSWYGIFMAPDTIILFGVLVRSNGKLIVLQL
ncbi:hypothetical protein J7J00_25120 [Bacillus sp. ISL-4]|nr:hypothetical protein [Bacillus sp. ISL-4]MBT2668714.1 hypothetical protein [Bacillus sp. ISL-4]